MKIGGIVPTRAEEVLILPRPMADDIVIKAHAVEDMELFDKLCPEPKPPAVLKAGGFVEDTESTAYLSQMSKHGELRFAYIAINSLKPSEIEWSEVDPEKPGTWMKWTAELKEAGLSSNEIKRVTICVMQANSLDEAKLRQAREVFLLGRGKVAPKSSGQDTAPESTPSGEPAPDSESALPE